MEDVQRIPPRPREEFRESGSLPEHDGIRLEYSFPSSLHSRVKCLGGSVLAGDGGFCGRRDCGKLGGAHLIGSNSLEIDIQDRKEPERQYPINSSLDGRDHRRRKRSEIPRAGLLELRGQECVQVSRKRCEGEGDVQVSIVRTKHPRF